MLPPSVCIKNMFNNLQKIFSVKRDKEIDVRSYWCVGLTKSEDIQELEEKILDHQKNRVNTL